MSAQPEEKAAQVERIETSLTQWAVQCRTREGDLFTGRPFASEREARESGERLTRINGAEWWLVTRRRDLTVDTWPWATPEITP